MVPADQKYSATMYRPEDFGEKFKEKLAKQADAQGQLPEVKHGVHELLPNIEGSEKNIGQKAERSISAEEYISSPSARAAYRDQAAGRVQNYVAELREKGLSETQVAKVEGKLQERLNDPAAAYSLKEGLDLREGRKEVNQTSSTEVVSAYYDKRQQTSADVEKVRQAFGAQGREKTPQELQRDKISTGWDRTRDEQLAKLRHNVEQGHLNKEEQPKQEQRIRGLAEKQKEKALSRELGENKKEVTEQRKKAGGGGGEMEPREPSIRQSKCYPVTRDILAI